MKTIHAVYNNIVNNLNKSIFRENLNGATYDMVNK